MSFDAVEANIPRFNPLARNNTAPPEIQKSAQNVAKTIYDRTLEEPCDRIYVHNIGNGAAKYAKNQVVTADIFHDYLAGEASALDGLGTKVTFDVRRDGIQSISFISADAGGLNLAIEKIRLPLGSTIQNVAE